MSPKSPLESGASISENSSKDREQGLADKFEDPTLEEIVPGFIAAESVASSSVVSEAADALQELVLDIANEPSEVVQLEESLADETFPLDMPVSDESVFEISSGEPSVEIEIQKDAVHASAVKRQAKLSEDNKIDPEKALLNARWNLAQKMFDLVICDVSFDSLIDGILSAIVSALEAEAGSILELDSGNNEFFFRASIGGGDRENLKTFRVPANKGIVGYVAESKEILLLKDLEEDERQLRAISMSSGFETRTCIAAPILIKNKLYGVLELFNKKNAPFFHEKDVRIVEDAVKMASKALEVRFLMSEILRRKR